MCPHNFTLFTTTFSPRFPMPNTGDCLIFLISMPTRGNDLSKQVTNTTWTATTDCLRFTTTGCHPLSATRHRRRTARRERGATRQRTDRGGDDDDDEEQEQGQHMRRRPVIAGRHTKTNPPLTQLPQAPSSNTEDAAIDTESIPNEHDDNSLEPVTESDDDSDSLSLVDDKEIPDEQKNAPPPVLTRSGRQVKAPKRLIETCIASSQQRRKGFKSESKFDYGRGIKDKVASKTLNNQFLMALKWNRAIDLLRSHNLSAMNA